MNKPAFLATYVHNQAFNMLAKNLTLAKTNAMFTEEGCGNTVVLDHETGFLAHKVVHPCLVLEHGDHETC